VPSLGLACRVENFDYVDTLLGVTLGPLFVVAFLVFLFGLEVAIQKYKDIKLDATLKKDKRYAIPGDLASVFTKNEFGVFRRTFSYFDQYRSGKTDFSTLAFFNEKPELSFDEFMYTIQQAYQEGRQAEISDIISAVEAKTNARQGESIYFLLSLFSFIILIGTSSTIFEYFQCASFEEVTPAVSYLVRDYSLNCTSSRYKSFVAYAVAMLFIYPIG
jgi:sensor histidine kinase YesM